MRVIISTETVQTRIHSHRLNEPDKKNVFYGGGVGKGGGGGLSRFFLFILLFVCFFLSFATLSCAFANHPLDVEQDS